MNKLILPVKPPKSQLIPIGIIDESNKAPWLIKKPGKGTKQLQAQIQLSTCWCR
ncbi:MAG: hypothetical protein JXR22_14070 [Prolixibacteraceae bacterium]|nr:hypothetical protein [Prolixibacteraceae bacterium]